MRVASGDDKLSLDLVRSVEINCTYAGDSFEGKDLDCWPSRDRVSISPGALKAEIVCRLRRERVSISPGDILVFAGVRLSFVKSSPKWRIVGRERR